MLLTEKYRPKTFDDFRGSAVVLSMLKKMVSTDSLPNCLLFTGPKGTGKTSMCRILSNELEVLDTGYIEVDAASNSGVEDMRKLLASTKYYSPGSHRLVVLDEAHSLSSAAFNALLKDLEDPPAGVVFILVTTKPESIPDTVKSRSSIYRFQPLESKVIAKRLAEIVIAEELAVRDPKVLLRISEVVEGSMRAAIVMLQQLTLLDEPTVDAVNQLSGYTVSTNDLMYSMVSGNIGEFESSVSDVFSSSSDVDKILLSLIGTLKEFHDTGIISSSQFLSCVSIVWNMRSLQRNSDIVARTQLEAGLFAMFSQNFWNGLDKVDSTNIALATQSDIDSISVNR